MDKNLNNQENEHDNNAQSDVNNKTVMFTARVKVSDKDLFQKIAEEMGEGIKQADVFSQLLKNQSIINAIGSADPEQKGQVAALQAHVNMISKIFSNMMSGYKTVNQEVKEKYANDMHQKSEEVKLLKEKLNEIITYSKDIEEKRQEYLNRITELEGVNDVQEKAIIDKSEIIMARNSTLANLQIRIDELKELEEENKSLIEVANMKEKEVANLSIEIKSLKEELEKEKWEKDQQKEEQLKAIKSLSEKHQEDIEILKQRKDLEKDRAIVEIDGKHQEKINEIHTQYQEKQQELYNKIEGKDTLINNLKEQLRNSIQKQ